jgi:phosphoribosylformimino-5-aminoimidazole carboxamide ribotide isomerase
VRVIPAIDLREGACVQLVGGDYAEERVRIADPLAVARRWADAGFDLLHVVDLDAATGRGSNAAMVERLIDARVARLQVGGGVRDADDIERWLDRGVERVVVGTRAIEDPAWLVSCAERFPWRLAIAADARSGKLTTRGWSRTLESSPEDFASSVAPLPLAALLVTAVDREGGLAGPDTELIRGVVQHSRFPVLAAGGIASVDDLEALARAGAAAAVVGMGLYTGAIDPRALAEARS